MKSLGSKNLKESCTLVANFQLPVEGPLFDKVEFVELQRDESEKLVEEYNKEGREALPPPDKRYRDHGYDRGRSAYMTPCYSMRIHPPLFHFSQ